MSAQANGRLTGTMKWFDPRRGYGFCKTGDTPDGDYFCHISDFKGEYEPVEGDCISFVASKNGRQRARDIEILSSE